MSDSEIAKKRLSPDLAWKRVQKYCAYQERSQQEVRDKLYSFGLHATQVEEMIALLIADGFLKEARFAIAYATGRFHIKKWGRIRITEGLKEKKVSGPLIQQALSAIDPSEYRQTLQRLLDKKQHALKEKNVFKRNYKLAQYGIRQGYEPELVWELLHNKE